VKASPPAAAERQCSNCGARLGTLGQCTRAGVFPSQCARVSFERRPLSPGLLPAAAAVTLTPAPLPCGARDFVRALSCELSTGHEGPHAAGEYGWAASTPTATLLTPAAVYECNPCDFESVRPWAAAAHVGDTQHRVGLRSTQGRAPLIREQAPYPTPPRLLRAAVLLTRASARLGEAATCLEQARRDIEAARQEVPPGALAAHNALRAEVVARMMDARAAADVIPLLARAAEALALPRTEEPQGGAQQAAQDGGAL
jgi:hypothetical protein